MVSRLGLNNSFVATDIVDAAAAVAAPSAVNCASWRPVTTHARSSRVAPTALLRCGVDGTDGLRRRLLGGVGEAWSLAAAADGGCARRHAGWDRKEVRHGDGPW